MKVFTVVVPKMITLLHVKILLLAWAMGVGGQIQPCPDQCICQGKPDGDKYRVTCSDGTVDSLASLNLPPSTTAL